LHYPLCVFLYHFLFLIIPRPPTSTLFPYTTLFRSTDITVYFYNGMWAEAELVATDPQADLAVLQVTPPEGVTLQPLPLAGADTLDRKSTRLNSSHVKISYAVFCLKKKKEQREHTHN